MKIAEMVEWKEAADKLKFSRTERYRERKKRVAIYCRVSTIMDAQDGSYETQISYFKNQIEQNAHMILADVYGDWGKSGRFMKSRPEFQRMLKDCRAGKIDLIVTKSISRFARNMSECIAAIRQLERMGVAIIFEREELNTRMEANEMMISILAAIAQEESNSMSQNMRWSRRKKYEAGQPCEKPSYGYRSVGKKHRWITEEREGKRVRLAFYMAGMCCKYAEIRDALNELEEREDTGKVWNHTPVVHMLTNLVYMGDYLTNKEYVYADAEGLRKGKNCGQADQFYIEEHHEALVSRELFEHVQELIKQKLLFGCKKKFSAGEKVFMEECRKLAQEEQYRRMQEAGTRER